ncbi:uncharacterized protein KQ657_000824 [Scheffersomyces spartinae]|uniref:Bacterial surface antigen (D15) domain-containing protein n=1 Tax=Scheffersomyces spartinae TaxID=45513 RepID=A0A9P7V8M3_9ASCO|nr:uncharacterized protein KQ657_000824 [Scheffersomyces spartinae]KAG7193406.1 hypothetical protein KQ657_000824 [Scheffersomyces spartinae]
MRALEDDLEDRLLKLQDSKDDKNKTPLEKALEKLLNDKQELMLEQNRRYLTALFEDQLLAPIKIRNAQVTNSQSFRSSFIRAQLQPLLKSNINTLSNFFEAIDESTRNLLKSRLVDNVVISIQTLPRNYYNRHKPSIEVVPIFQVIPVKRFFAKSGTNIGNGEGDTYIQFQFKNLWGGAENISFDATTGTKTSLSYLVNYTQPLFNNVAYLMENLWYRNTRLLEWIQSEVQTTGTTLRCSTQYDGPWNHDLLMEASWRVLNNLNSKADDVLLGAGSDFKKSINYTGVHDTRDAKILPTSGKLLKWSFELNPWSYFKLAFEAQFAHKLNANHSILFKTKSGALYPFTDVSNILDRFNIGGPNDVRSFMMNGLGPKQFASSVGGDIFINGGISMISKLPGVPVDSGFKLHTFINGGRLIACDKSKGVYGNVRELLDGGSLSTGLGILYNHPAARFELNLVFPLVAHKRDSLRKGVEAGIGISFL